MTNFFLPSRLLKLNTSTVESTNGKLKVWNTTLPESIIDLKVRLRELNLFSVEMRQGDLIWDDFIAAFQYPKRAYKKNGEHVLTGQGGMNTN